MSDYSELVKYLRSRAKMQTATGTSDPSDHIDWMAADAIQRLARERDEVVALAKDTEDARVEVAIRLMEVAREKHETEARAEKAEAALMAEPEDLTLQICFDKVVKDRDAYKARAERAEAALSSLTLSVRGTWDAFERALRSEVGNTNYNCVSEKIDRARAVLAQIEGETP